MTDDVDDLIELDPGPGTVEPDSSAIAGDNTEPGEADVFRSLCAGLHNVTLERRPQGDVVVRTLCRICENPLTLPCVDSYGTPMMPNRVALCLGGLMVCTTCDERRTAAREAKELRERQERLAVDDVDAAPPAGPTSSTGAPMSF